MLICRDGDNFKYCHFDENNFDELKCFVDLSFKIGDRSIGLFGGYGSQNISKLIRYINKKNLKIMRQKNFVNFSPLKRIKVFNDDFYFLGNSERKKYNFEDLYKILD